ncbi:phytanoyl-CoA dioxygenase family protein [Minwuia sp.]|uniref:phytanoyl-CoA dioxygenase family protein n=1 Tax=Minwuia sp. TaxID=2493630 RepID=UPI003A95CC1D
MTPEDILKEPARALTQSQREFYFEQGYLCIESFVPRETVAEMVAITDAFVEASRRETEPGSTFDIAPNHTAEHPVVRRIKRPDDQHEGYWDFAKGLIADVAADLLGPDVLFHHSKLNFKWPDATSEVKWHQDIQFYPHTNYNVLAIGCYLADTDMSNGAVGVLPGSHNGPLYDQYDANGNWTGMLNDADNAAIDMSKARYMTGPAGSITIHNCRTVHYSVASKSPNPRPLLLNSYSSADAKAYTPHPDPSSHAYEVVRGQTSRWAAHDPRPCQIPPDWSGGYTSIFAAQAGENEGKAA